MNKNSILEKARTDNMRSDEGKEYIESKSNTYGICGLLVACTIIGIMRFNSNMSFISSETSLLLDFTFAFGFYGKFKTTRKKKHLFLMIFFGLVSILGLWTFIGKLS